MKRNLMLVRSFVLVLVIFGGLRVYGSYQTEKDAALTRAADADTKADWLEAEGEQVKRQNECNGLWEKHETALLEKRLAELRGQFAASPAEPSCTGYAPKLDEALDRIFKAAELSMKAISVREYARCERNYAANRRLQTRYLSLRLWAFMTGTELRKRQAEMEQDQENAANLASCLARAKSVRDTSLESTCRGMFGKT